jgi:HK97 family phage major capsid protein
MNRNQLRADKAAKLQAAEAILATATDETPISAEQQTQAEAYIQEAEQLQATLDALQAREEAATALRNRIQTARNAPDNQTTRAIANNLGLAHGVHAGHDVARQFSLPTNIRRVPLKNFAANHDTPAEVRAYRFGMWAMAMISETGSIPYRNSAAVAYCRDNGLFAAAHGEGGSDTTGAHVLVPDEFGTDLILLRERYGAARQVLNVVNMNSDTKTEPRQLSGLTAYFTAENAAITESTMSFDNVTLVAKKLAVITRMSNELSSDNVLGLADRLIGEIAYAFAYKEDDCAFNGTGTSTYGGITGIRTRLDELTAGTAPGLTLGSGNQWSELTLSDFNKVVGSLPSYADVPGAAWICHKVFEQTVMQKLAYAAGGVLASEIVNGIRRSTFLGYPVITSAVFPKTEANSQIPVIFGGYSLGAMFGSRGQESIAFSTEATVGGQSMWERDQIGVRGTERFDVVVHDYGSNSEAGPIVGLETAGS